MSETVCTQTTSAYPHGILLPAHARSYVQSAYQQARGLSVGST